MYFTLCHLFLISLRCGVMYVTFPVAPPLSMTFLHPEHKLHLRRAVVPVGVPGVLHDSC